MDRITLLILGIGLWGCSSRSDTGASIDAADSIDDAPVGLSTAEHDASGAWILSEFQDSIIQQRAIGRYRLPIPVWTALVLRVDSSTVKCNGTLLPHTKKYSRSGKDTLLVLDAYGMQTFVYDAIEDRIQVLFKNEADTKEAVMEYRRIRPEEHHLMAGIDAQHRDSMFRFEENYHAYLTGLLFTGRFEPLDRGQHAFNIDEKGRISGHPIWNEFWFHDYFGTLHPFEGDVDGLVFTDSTKQWPHNTFPFNWRFAGDTLFLRSMSTDGDRYYTAEGVLRFLKRG